MRVSASLLFCVLLSAASDAQDSCAQFSVVSEEGEASAPAEMTSTLTSISVDVNETVSVNSTLYRVYWTGVLATDPYTNEDDNNDALNYLTYDVDNSTKLMTVDVSQSVEGLVDFTNPDPTNHLEFSLYFQFSSVELTCRLLIDHNLQDENTQTPFFPEDVQQVTLREDYPLGLPIPDLTPEAYDYDVLNPNNQFEVTMDDACPLETTQSSYTCEGGKAVEVQYQLRIPLDYDTMEEPYTHVCTATLEDYGTPARSSSAQVKVTVEASDDQAPEFTSDFYSGNLAQSTEGTPVDTDPLIEASDPDVPPTALVYSMEEADPTVGGDEYFSIDATTGAVTVSRDIDDEFLSWGSVQFVLKVCDSSSACGKAFLGISLPILSVEEDWVIFEQLTYTSQVLPPEKDEEILRVHAQTSGNQEDIVYSFEDDGSAGLEYFSIGEFSGSIFAIQDDTPPMHYVMSALATDGNQTDRTTVNILVLTPSNNSIQMEESVTVVKVRENEVTSLLVVEAEGASYFCLLAVTPEQFFPYFTLDNYSGDLRVSKPLDADDVSMGTRVSLKVGAYENDTECVNSPITSQVKNNEEVIEVIIEDVNEFSPAFVDLSGNIVNEVLFGYPCERSLQRAVGPVGTVLVEDMDVTSSVSFSVDNDISFAIDSETGDVFVIGEFKCSDGYNFVVQATDSHFSNSLNVQVRELSLDSILTLTFDGLTLEEVQEQLSQLSSAANVSIFLLYATVVAPSDARALVKGNLFQVDAQVYATSGMEFLSLSQLNEALSSAGLDLSARPFSDSEVFRNEDGFKTATIVLGCLLGLTLTTLAAFIGVSICRKNQRRKSSAKHISTLGQAYANSAFQDPKDSEPTFSSIFGDLPRGSESSTKNARPNSSSVGSNESPRPANLGDSTLRESGHSSLPGHSGVDTNGGGDYKLGRPLFFQTQDPSFQMTSTYEDEITAATKHIEDAGSKSASADEGVYTPPADDQRESTKPSAPAEEDLVEDDKVCIVAESSDTKSNLKLYPDLSIGEEPKSVAFKVLVHTKEFDQDEGEQVPESGETSLEPHQDKDESENLTQKFEWNANVGST